MRRQTLAALAATTAALAAPAAASAADALYGVTDQNHLIRFTSQAPGADLEDVALQGLGTGEKVVALDVRPSDDQVVAVTSANRAVQVNPVTGATRAAYGPFSPSLSGTSFGSDFNPTNDSLRITSDADQNLRVSPANVTTAEGPLAYAAGDPGAGTDPSVGAVAYTNSTPGATTTALYGIESARDALVRVDPPNAGTLTTVGPLGQAVDEPAGLDIAPDGNTAYAALKRTGQPAFGLYRVDLSTGAATATPAANGIAVPANAGALVDLAVAGPVPDDTTRPTLSVAFSSTILEQNTDVLKPSVSCDEACAVTVRARVAGRSAGTGARVLPAAGRATVSVPLSRSARARIARKGTELIALDIEAVDAAGNRSSQTNRIARTQTLAGRRAG